MKYRKDKLFTGKKVEDISFIGSSISACFIDNYLSNNKNKSDPLYRKLISQKLDNNDYKFYMDLIKSISKYKNYDQLFEAAEKGNLDDLPNPDKYLVENYDIEKIKNTRKNIMEKFDGYDFSDIIEEGIGCEQSLTKIWSKPFSNYVNQ